MYIFNIQSDVKLLDMQQNFDLETMTAGGGTLPQDPKILSKFC